MSEPEDFIARWSRRKAAATEAPEAKTEAPAAEPVAGEEKSGAPPVPLQGETAATAIDPATLPPIESIEAGTDIATFLRAGVPAEITRAALRRVWATDPAIRDFIGLSENAWDFTAPDGVPGFGPLSADDASRLMADFTGKARDVVEQIRAFETPAEPAQVAPSASDFVVQPVIRDGSEELRDGSEELRDGSEELARAEPDQPAAEPQAFIKSNVVQRDKENGATQHERVETVDNVRLTRRTHGSALPE